MSNPTCATCRWYRAYSDGAGSGQCYRHPPTVLQRADEVEPYAARPEVYESEFCGEHAARDPEAAA